MVARRPQHAPHDRGTRRRPRKRFPRRRSNAQELAHPIFIQYWRSFEHLHAYAHDPARNHQPAWRAFNTAIGGDGSVGIFHETYIVDPGRHESIYVNMPPIGLGAISNTLPATGNRKDARRRMGKTHHLPNKPAP